MRGRFRIPTVVAVLGLALCGCAADGTPPEHPNAAAEITMSEAIRSKAPEECEETVIVEHASSGYDDSDLVGFSDNVFVGRVEERVGSTGVTPARPWGSTRFSVEVLENVKGRLGGGVTVGQDGAYDKGRGCVALAEDDPLLRPGQEVMLFTRRDEGRGLHQIVTPGYGDVRIEGEGEREELVRRFERARKNQTDPTPGRH